MQKRRIRMRVLPMLFSAGATAQSVVVSNLGLKDTAIVRPFGEEYALTYSDNAFVLCNGHDHTALAFNVPFIVRDVEIWNDETAYYDSLVIGGQQIGTGQLCSDHVFCN